jgi:hypothetical protein
MSATTMAARYLYAIVRGLPEDAEIGPGLSGAPVEVVRVRDLAALVSTVDLDEFGDEGLHANLERLEWLEEVVRTHDAVVLEAGRHGPVAPLRLATVCRDDDDVRRRVEELRDALTLVLDRVEGCHEWSVKVVAPPTRTRELVALGASTRTVGGSEPPWSGRSAGEERARRESEAHVAAERIHDAVAATALASRRLPLQDPRLTGLTGPTGAMVHHGAYLVPVYREEAFLATVRLMQGTGEVTVCCTGPCPPYSFAMLDAP